MTQELGPNQKLWIKALRSGFYQQGASYLNRDGECCCLGVACEVFGLEREASAHDGETYRYGIDKSTAIAPPEVLNALALRDFEGRAYDFPYKKLVQLNDSEGASFSDIASLLETVPHQYFKEPR